jgi:F-type H+-transporting ATPase subunit epsilon
MAEKTLQCSVITPETQAFEGEVDAVVLPAHDGEIGILFNRAPLLCKLGAGSLRVRNGIEEESWFIDGGFAQVIDNQVTVLTNKAVPSENIVRADAEACLAKALEMPATDEIAASRKAQAVASARAQLRMAR